MLPNYKLRVIVNVGQLTWLESIIQPEQTDLKIEFQLNSSDQYQFICLYIIIFFLLVTY